MVGRFLPDRIASPNVTLPFPKLQFRSVLRLQLLITLISLMQPAPLLIVPGPPQTVHTSHAIVGVHTRLTDEVEEWKIQRSLEMVRQMGSPWIVQLFPWAYYHPADGGIAWEHPDMVMDHFETPAPHIPGGMKGVGEGGTIVAPVAIGNAIAAAVPEIAGLILETPLSPGRLWELLRIGGLINE